MADQEEQIISFKKRTETVMVFFDERNIQEGVFFFDAVVEEVHDAEIEITENPVEFGANISDHAFRLPLTLALKGRVSDVSFRFRENDPLENSISEENSSRSADAWELLNKIMNSFRPVLIDTHLKAYDNMAITSLRTTQDVETARVLDVEIMLKEIIVVQAPESDYKTESAETVFNVTSEVVPVQESQSSGTGGLGGTVKTESLFKRVFLK
jgi:hypothetical protein